MKKIATDVEQGEQLMVLGIDPDITADMCWSRSNTDEEYSLDVLQAPYHKRLFSHRNGFTRPAWSLQALISLMPNDIEIGGDPFKLRIDTDSVCYIDEWDLNDVRAVLFFAEGEQTLVDVAAEMVVFLKEKKYI